MAKAPDKARGTGLTASAPRVPGPDTAPRVSSPSASRGAQVVERSPDAAVHSGLLLSALADPASGGGALSRSRAQAGQALQRRIGNARAERSLGAIARRGSGADSRAVPESVADHVGRTRGQGQPLDQHTRSDMENHFSRDLSGVRVHTGDDSGHAARAAGAHAFATGRDIYFAPDRYQPQTDRGRHLLAHEVAHTVQHGAAAPIKKAAEGMSSPEDPAEREAEQAADRVSQGLPAGVTPTSVTVGGAEVAATEGGLLVKLGSGVSFQATELKGRGAKLSLDLGAKPALVPGLALKTFHYWPRQEKGQILADLAVPFVPSLRGGVKVSVDKDGLTKLEGKLAPKLSLGALRDPTLELRIDEANNIGGTVAISADQMKVPGVRNLLVSGGGEVVLAQGKLSGEVNAHLEYKGFAAGDFALSFKEGVPEGSGKLDVTHPVLAGASASLALVGGDLTAEATVPVDTIVPALPGIQVPSGTLTLKMQNGDLSGSLTDLAVKYKGFGEGVLSGSISKGEASAEGSFALLVPAIEPVKGTFGMRKGAMHGSLTVSSKDFPEGLPIKSGSITGAIGATGQASFKGEVAIEFAGVGRGNLRASYDEAGELSLGADVTLSVPGLQGISGTIDYENGQLAGSLDVPIESEKLAGLQGNLHVEYREGLWKGEQKFLYERDDGKLKGEVLLGLAQKDTGKLAVYGGGDVTAQLTSFLKGSLGVNIEEDGTTHISGAISVTEPLPLFPEKKMDRELFSVSQNIPLWAILVAVVRARGGVRAGIGPGVLRDITVEGEYTVGADTPSFSISGELFIPAYVEAYVALGAGLGLDVVLGSLTGGIELVGTAGIYGAVSVLPVISYENGEFSIDGTATLAAGAKLKLGIQAWAEIEALWVTIWEETWSIGEWMWDVGPTLALQADMHYKFGHPEPPSLDFKTDNIDAERLLQDAMPKDGPAGSGARDALKNRAEWSGRNKGKGESAEKGAEEAVPKDSAAPGIQAPAKPSPKAKPTDGAMPEAGPVKEQGGKLTPALQKTIEDAAKDKTEADPAKGEPAAVPIPSFPAPTQAEIDINWANYLEETKGKGPVEQLQFTSKMNAGEVYHPKLRGWSTVGDDYTKAFATLKDEQKAAPYFAAKMRGGYVPGSILLDSNYDPQLEKPVPDGGNVPYPIHFPTQFLLSTFESFNVSGGLSITPHAPKAYSVDVGSIIYDYTFGVDASWAARMNVGSVLQRQAATRSNLTSTLWTRWRDIGFVGGGASGSTVAVPSLSGGKVDASMFRKSSRPDGTELAQTFGQLIDSDPSFSNYRALRTADQDAFRADARNGKFDVDDPAHVQQWCDYLKAKTQSEANQRGVSGYELQHVLPLFLGGSSADTEGNLWPLAVSQHREGHRILADQPQLLQWGAPSHHIESKQFESGFKEGGAKFVVKKHGSSL